MSYGLAIAGDVRPDLRALDPWLQEEALDELDILTADPSVLPSSVPGADMVYVFSRTAGAEKHYVAMTLSRNDVTKMITVLGLSHRKLTLPPQR